MAPLRDRLLGLDFEFCVCDGHDLESMRNALAPTSAASRAKPRMVILNTVKGHGIPEVEGKMESHYLPPTPAQFADAVASFEADT